jgi:hypothetical protein
MGIKDAILQKETYKDVIPSFNGNCFTRQTKTLVF